jgi:hypothetical protein
MRDKIRVFREQNLFNRAAVTGEASKQYIWVNRREERRTWYEGMGFAVVKATSPPRVHASVPPGPDGTYLRGDLILYECDKEFYDAMALDNALRGFESINAATDQFINNIAREGVPAFKPPIRG